MLTQRNLLQSHGESLTNPGAFLEVKAEPVAQEGEAAVGAAQLQEALLRQIRAHHLRPLRVHIQPAVPAHTHRHLTYLLLSCFILLFDLMDESVQIFSTAIYASYKISNADIIAREECVQYTKAPALQRGAECGMLCTQHHEYPLLYQHPHDGMRGKGGSEGWGAHEVQKDQYSGYRCMEAMSMLGRLKMALESSP